MKVPPWGIWARRIPLGAAYGVVIWGLASRPHQPFDGLALATLVLLGAASMVRRFRLQGEPTNSEALELGFSVLGIVFAIVGFGGELAFPLVMLVSGLLVAFLPLGASLVLLFGIVGGIAAVTLPSDLGTFAIQSAFAVAFAGMYRFALFEQRAAARSAQALALAKEHREVEERARVYRLTSGDGEKARTDQWALAAVKEIERSSGLILEVLEAALRTHCVAVLLRTVDEEALILHDARTASDSFRRERIPIGIGVFGAVVRSAQPLRLFDERGVGGITHYAENETRIAALACVPLIDGAGAVRGILLADRTEPEPFSESDARILETTGREVLRAIEVERVLIALRRSRDEKESFFKAIEELNRANGPDEVWTAVVESARQVAPLDFCALTLVSEAAERPRTHSIARIVGAANASQALQGSLFEDNGGLVANAVRYGASFAASEAEGIDKQVVFTPEVRIRGLNALKVIPMIASDRVVGTLVVGSRKKGSLSSDEQRMLEVLAIQAGQAALRAQLYEQMERLATCDGLTGLCNVRSLHDRFDRVLATSLRYQRLLAFVLCDVDHFKAVNDTHGHPVGDQVLREVAKVLAAEARATDIVARYGGEEFAIVMPETDARGASTIAERIRMRMMQEVFPSAQGAFSVTISMGIAALGPGTATKADLIELADQRLYAAKRGGRNQVIADSSGPERRMALRA